MLKALAKILIFILITADCLAQDNNPGPGFQTVLMDNPAFAGSEGDGILRLSYLNYYPGNSYNLHSVYLSYDSYFPELHGGAGFYLTDDYLGGIVNDLKGGISYAYYLQAGNDLFINAGLTGSFYHRGYNFEGAILPDQIDPLGGVTRQSSEVLSLSGRTVFDIGTGFLFISGNFFGGLSINHLAEPEIARSDMSGEKLRRKLFVYLSGDINLNKSNNLKLQPVGSFSYEKDFLTASAGTIIESNYLSVNAIVMADSGENLNIQTGFSLKISRIQLFYNYKFSAFSGNRLMPISLIHQTGIAISLNNVDKRNIIKTINFPKM